MKWTLILALVVTTAVWWISYRQPPVQITAPDTSERVRQDALAPASPVSGPPDERVSEPATPPQPKSDEPFANIDLTVFESIEQLRDNDVLMLFKQLREAGVDIPALMIYLIEQGTLDPNVPLLHVTPSMIPLQMAMSYDKEITLEEAKALTDLGSYLDINNVNALPLSTLKNPEVAAYLMDEAGFGYEHRASIFLTSVIFANEPLFEYMNKSDPSFAADPDIMKKLDPLLSDVETLATSAEQLRNHLAKDPSLSEAKIDAVVAHLYEKEIAKYNLVTRLTTLNVSDREKIRQTMSEIEAARALLNNAETAR